MDAQEKKDFENLKKDFAKLSDLFYRQNLQSQKYYERPLLVRGFIQMFGRIMQKKGVNIVAANDLILGNQALAGSDGNSFTVTGNTTINAITVGTWQAGSEITLIFSGTPTVKHNTAGSTGTAKIFLNGSADLTAANNTVLTLIYDGTQWQEKSRKIA